MYQYYLREVWFVAHGLIDVDGLLWTVSFLQMQEALISFEEVRSCKNMDNVHDSIVGLKTRLG